MTNERSATADGGDRVVDVEDDVVVSSSPRELDTDAAWQRLDARMIWVDAVQILLSLAPTAFAVLVLGVEAGQGTLWPVVGIAIFGCVGAVSDALRWAVTRYRVTDEYVERRTGILVRQYRSIPLDRVRSIDSTAKLRHRLARLRPLKIGAGQQSATGEAALELDAVSAETARQLRHDLLERHRSHASGGDTTSAADATDASDADAAATVAASTAADHELPAGHAPERHLIATIQWTWIVYNVFNIWAYAMAVGLIWGGNWLAATFGLNPIQAIVDTFDRASLGVGWTVAVAVVSVGALGAVGLAAQFVSANWGLRLERVPGAEATVLRTTRGMFTTREVNRDDRRLRGISISEPVIWRWMKMADTTVITTGLSMWSEAATIIPRGPRRVARQVAAAVLEVEPADSPFEAPLVGHPRAALRRRLVWATGVTAVVVGILVWFAVTIPGLPLWVAGIVAAALLPVLVVFAVSTYRALGHAISGDYLVTRTGGVSWATNALRRKAVSGVTVRQSLLQRRLGLATVSMSTAAGWGEYRAPDVDAAEAAGFADEASCGLLAAYLVNDSEP